jgi:hypothetical protein
MFYGSQRSDFVVPGQGTWGSCAHEGANGAPQNGTTNQQVWNSISKGLCLIDYVTIVV